MKQTGGFTFIEILVAMVVVAMLAAGLGGSMTTLARDATLGRERSQMAFLLQATAEEILGERRAAPFGFDRIPTSLPSWRVHGQTYTRALSVTSGAPGRHGCPPLAAAGACREVVLTVTAPSRARARAFLLLTDYD